MQTTEAPVSAKTKGFLREGMAELGRKIERSKLRNQLRQQGRESQEALVALGRRAWAEKVDISAFASLREQLESLEARGNAVAQKSRDLDAEKQSREEERRAAVANFDQRRRAIEGAKKPVDAALQAARDRLSEHDRATRTTEARLAAVGAELAKLERQIAQLEAGAAPGKADQISAARAKGVQLGAEQTQLQSGLPAAKAASGPLAAEVNRLWGESQRHQQQIDAVEAERKSALAPMDAALGQVREGLSAAGREAGAIEQERIERFRQLGLALCERKPADPRLDDAIRRIGALDRERDAVSAALASSEGVTQTLPRGTMLKFWSTALLAAVVIIAAGIGGAWYLFSPPSDRAARPEHQYAVHTGTAQAPTAAQQEYEKDGAVSALLELRSSGKAPDAASQKTRDAAVEVLKDDLLLVGSSADPTYLPIFAKILKSDAPELRAAAAHAMAMARPGSAQIPVLEDALNDPVRSVREAALGALEQVKDNAGPRLLVRRVQGAAAHPQSQELLTPEPAPDAKQLGIPIYEGATYLYFASNSGIGRAAFSTPDPLQKVLAFYTSKAGRPAMTGDEFTRTYLGGSPNDPTGGKRLATETQAWLERMFKAQTPTAEVEAEGDRRANLMLDLPLLRYNDTELYGAPSFVALEETSVEGKKSSPRYVAVFEDHTVGRTGFEMHVATEAKQN